MTKRRQPRALTAEERRLWAHVAREVRPLGGKALPEAAAPDGPEFAEPPPARDEPGRPPVVQAPALPPLAPLERRTRIALRRGARTVDAVIDLHGLRQREAHAALLSFLRRSQAMGCGVVLVITGKGTAGASDLFLEERGVLRRLVPHWLRLPDLRPLVIGFEESAPHHGGAGALYVRLRRPRAPRA